jgi:hypothetical protein
MLNAEINSIIYFPAQHPCLHEIHLQYCNFLFTCEEAVATGSKKWEKWNVVPVPVYISMWLNSRRCSHLAVKFSFFRHEYNPVLCNVVLMVDNINLEQEYSPSCQLKNLSSSQWLTSAASYRSSSSGYSKFSTFTTDLYKHFRPQTCYL